MKKIFALLLALAMLLALSACGGGDEATYQVGICQIVQHEALDDATQGFMDALNEALPGQVKFDNQNASNDLSLCSSIINQFIANDVDLIMANATPALQSAAAATVEIPILGTSVTEYGVALEIEGFDGTVGDNISGTSDFASLEQQAAMVKEWFPDAKTVALLYCSAEANSQYQVDGMKAELEKLGYTCDYYAFTDSNDISPVVQGAAEACDVIYVPTDNTVAASAEIINNVCRPVGRPVIGGDGGICGSCTVAALCIEYYDLGYTTGKMAAKVLTGEADISEMPIEYAEAKAVYNAEICADLGISVPDGYTALESDK